MRRLRLLIAGFALALLAPLALLVHRAVSSVALERQMRHQALAERLFDEMERALSRLLEREEGIPFAVRVDPAERIDFPFLVGRFEVEPGGRLDLEAAAPAADRAGGGRNEGAEGTAPVEERLREVVRDFAADAGDAPRVRGDEIDQQPGSTLDLRAAKEAPEAERKARAETDAVSSYAALRSLNKAVQERVARQKKAEAPEARSAGRDAFAEQDDAAFAELGAARSDAPASPRDGALALPTSADGDERGPFQGRIVDQRHALLYRTAPRAARLYRQGVVLDVLALQEWLRAQALSDTALAAYAQLVFATPFAAPSAVDAADAFVYRHRFAEPFADLSARLALRPLPGLGSMTYIYALATASLVAALLGLAALYRMVSVVVSFAERRGNFVAAVTHELKTPLTAIRMYGEMLRDGMAPSEAKRAEYYRHITVEAERLSRLINNVLEFSRLEKGNRDVTLVRGDVGAVVREAAELLRPHVAAQGFALQVEVSGDLPEVRFERDALLQILFNLIDNAVKYAGDAADRRITLSAQRAGRGVRIAVRDQGPGVPSRHLGRIFDAFYRGEDELTRRSKGTGLGLALVRGLAERMGATATGRNLPECGFAVEVDLASDVD